MSKGILLSVISAGALACSSAQTYASDLPLDNPLNKAGKIVSAAGSIRKAVQKAANGQIPLPSAPIPEPSSALLLLGSGMVLLARRRRA